MDTTKRSRTQISEVNMRASLALCLLMTITAWSVEPVDLSQPVGDVPIQLREDWKLGFFYKKYLNVGGMAVVSSDLVADEALIEARYIIHSMVGHRPDILAAIGKTKVRLAIMAPTEFTTDVPEHGHLRPREYWDQRARGLGASPANPCFSCGEENLLEFPGDPYAAENILIHEFAHVIHHCGLNTVDPTFDRRLAEAFANAKKQGLWQGKYAGTNRAEYWAEGVQSWFDDNRTNDHDHNHVHLRAQLKEYDPMLAALCLEVLGEREWRYVRPSKRTPPSPHLARFDREKAPRFSWDELERQRQAGQRDGERNRLVLQLPNSSPRWESPANNRPVVVHVANMLKRPVDIYWIDEGGQPTNKLTVRYGDLREIKTFMGHVFRVQDGEDESVRGYFVAGDSESDLVLREMK